MAGTREYEDLNKNLEMVDGHAVKAPEDYQDPEELYQALIARVRKYHPSADITMIEKAYQIGKEAHKDQFRKSGEPYIIHPLWVAIILADLEMDKETIVAGMLHDVVEDTTMTLDEISTEFGEEVALLVDGVTKLGLFQGQAGGPGREFEKDVPCNGEGYPCHHCKTCRPSA